MTDHGLLSTDEIEAIEEQPTGQYRRPAELTDVPYSPPDDEAEALRRLERLRGRP